MPLNTSRDKNRFFSGAAISVIIDEFRDGILKRRHHFNYVLTAFADIYFFFADFHVFNVFAKKKIFESVQLKNAAVFI